VRELTIQETSRARDLVLHERDLRDVIHAAEALLVGLDRQRGISTEQPRAIQQRSLWIAAVVLYALARWKPATAHNRYHALRSFFGWLVGEGEIKESPMARMKPPKVPEAPPPVLRHAELRAVIAACEGDKSFAGRRDEAIIRCFSDTGARRGEILGLTCRGRTPGRPDVARDGQGQPHAPGGHRHDDGKGARPLLARTS
jgi:integrase